MAGFWRNRKTDLTGPPKYIQATDRTSRPLSILFSLVIFCLVIALFSGLYFGGKWAVDSIGGDANTASVQQPTAPSIEGGVTATTPTAASTTAPGQSPASTQSTANPDTSKGSVRASVAASAAVPNTGPEGIVVVFIGSFIIGVLGYRAVMIRRLS